MEPMSHTRKMREEFRVSIRRERKQEIFRELRTKQKVSFIEEEQKKMMQILNTQEKRQDWILRKSRDLSGEPDSTWRFIMNQLFWSILCFKGKGSFKIWIESGIIKSLCTLFHEDYKDLNLAPEAAKLLGNVIFLEEAQEEEKASFVAKEIFEQEILDSLINLISEHGLPHSETSYLVTLLGNLAANQRDPIIKQGGFKVCVDWSSRMLKDHKINRAYLQQIYSFFQMLSFYMNEIPTNYNFANQVFTVFTDFIEIDQSNELINKILSIISKILSYNKEKVYSTLLQNNVMMKRIFYLSTSDQESIREQSWKILGYLSSSPKYVKEVFINFGFMDVMWHAYAIQPVPNGRFDRITENMMVCLSNLAAEDDDMRDQIISHNVMNIAYESTHEERSINLKKNAYYMLCTFLRTSNFNLCRKVLYDTPIYEKLVLGLDHMIDKDASTIRDLLDTLLQVIQADRKVYRYHEDGILEILVTKYFFNNVLVNIQEKHFGNHNIIRICDQIFDLCSTN